jgi:cytochrome c-type biogenesis protein CcmH
VVVGATGLYYQFGAPALPDAPFIERVAQRTPPDSQHLAMQQAARRLEQKLLSDPSNAEGWVLYARTESILGDWQKASAAYRHAIDLGQKAPNVYAGYGEMLVLAADGIVPPAAEDAFRSALAGDARNDVHWPTVRPARKNRPSKSGWRLLPTFRPTRRCAMRSHAG